MWGIVLDEQRSNGANLARPVGVALGNMLAGVVPLARGNQPALRVTPTQHVSQGDHDEFYPTRQAL